MGVGKGEEIAKKLWRLDLKRQGRDWRQGHKDEQKPSIYIKALARLLFADETVDIGFCRQVLKKG